MVEFKPVCDEAIEYIAANMRVADAAEVWASNRFTPSQALKQSVDLSDFSTVAWINGVPCSIFGLMKRDSVLFSSGVPWLLSANEVLKHKREILKHSRGVLYDMLNICPLLVNYVHIENKVSIRWLKWLGFTIEPAVQYGVECDFFHRFYIER